MVRAGWLQTVKGSEYSADALSQQVATVEVPGIRGAILDRRGNALAVSEEAATIFATPYQVKNPPKEAKQLAAALDVPEGDILDSLTAQSGFEYVAQKVDVVTADRVEKLGRRRDRDPPALASCLSPGQGRGAADRRHRRRRAGTFGVEQSENDVLAGTDGEVAITKDALGQDINRDVVTGTAAGHDVQLTIDGRIQSYTEKVLGDIGDRYMPEDATAIVMDPTDGDVLAMASWPPVDPSDLSDADPDQPMYWVSE